jgi:DNA invertase Pin-like site-specific DNA recombinase
MKIGYARVSTQDQSLDVQITALKAISCDVIYTDKISSTKVRPELDKALQALNKGDILIVYKLDRLGRSLSDLVIKLNYINHKKAEFVSIIDQFDTTTTQGKVLLGITMVFAEFERNLISDRTKASLKAIKDKGIKLGRQPYLDRKKAKLAYKMRVVQNYTVEHICRELNLTKPTFYRYVAMFK